jgi:type II secretory pathway pseudopilin PulG
MDRKTHTPFNATFYIVLTIIIVLVVAVVLPNLLRSRKTSSMEACIANMKQLEGAREQALLANPYAFSKGSPATHSTATVHAIYGPVASLRPFDCPSPEITEVNYVHSLYK